MAAEQYELRGVKVYQLNICEPIASLSFATHRAMAVCGSSHLDSALLFGSADEYGNGSRADRRKAVDQKRVGATVYWFDKKAVHESTKAIYTCCVIRCRGASNTGIGTGVR
jgi:hypothetical protein